MKTKKFNLKGLLLFTFFLIIISAIYVLITPKTAGQPDGSWRHEIGEFAGAILGWLLAIIYGRTLLKLIVKKGPIMARFLPDPNIERSKSFFKKVIVFLNKTHPYVGAGAIVMIFAHAFLEGIGQANMLMQSILLIGIWQFGFGIFLLRRYQMVFLKKMKPYGYMAHSQLYTGAALGIFALFGHLLVDG